MQKCIFKLTLFYGEVEKDHKRVNIIKTSVDSIIQIYWKCSSYVLKKISISLFSYQLIFYQCSSYKLCTYILMTLSIWPIYHYQTFWSIGILYSETRAVYIFIVSAYVLHKQSYIRIKYINVHELCKKKNMLTLTTDHLGPSGQMLE